MAKIFTFIISLVLLVSCAEENSEKSKEVDIREWKGVLSDQIKILGHRNWIVVADEAYPLQSSPGIVTLRSSETHLNTLNHVLSLITNQGHVKPIVYLDKEIDFVEEADAPGMSEYRKSLATLLGNQKVNKVIHEEIIGTLDKAAEQFNILIIKTDFEIPYTSVFFQLDCKYWSSDSEKRLRDKIGRDTLKLR